MGNNINTLAVLDPSPFDRREGKEIIMEIAADKDLFINSDVYAKYYGVHPHDDVATSSIIVKHRLKAISCLLSQMTSRGILARKRRKDLRSVGVYTLNTDNEVIHDYLTNKTYRNSQYIA